MFLNLRQLFQPTILLLKMNITELQSIKPGLIISLVDKKNKNRECIGNEKANDLGGSSGYRQDYC